MEGYKKNSNILKDKITILKFKRKRKKIQGLKAWEKLQCLEEQDQNSNDWKDTKGNIMFGRIR